MNIATIVGPQGRAILLAAKKAAQEAVSSTMVTATKTAEFIKEAADVVTSRVSRKEGRQLPSITAAMQREAFKKGGFYRLTVSGQIEFVRCNAVAEKIVESLDSKVEGAMRVLDNIINRVISAAKEARRKNKRNSWLDKNGIRFI